jgi:hypothetical protein
MRNIRVPIPEWEDLMDAVKLTTSGTNRIVRDTADVSGRTINSLSYTLSPLKKYSRNTIKFVRTGCCPNPSCQIDVGTDWNDRSRIRLFDQSGNEMSYGRFHKAIRNFECCSCQYSWPYLKPSDVLELVDVSRSEEPFGEDRREIDNSASDAEVTRSWEVTKEWTKTYEIKFERTEAKNSEESIGLAYLQKNRSSVR